MYTIRDITLLYGSSLSAWQSLTEHCRPLAEPSIATTLLAAFLVCGIVASYIPQHVKIWTRRSSDGLSPWWVLLGGLSSIAAIGNILVLPTSRADMQCCRELNGGACAAALLGVAQIGCQWTCFMIIILLYLVFYPYTAIEEDEDLAASITSLTATKPTNSRRDPAIVGISIFVAIFLVSIISLALVSSFPHRTQLWADILGTISGLLAAIQYLPQIHHTWVAKDMKSLSATTLAVQAPGSFLFALSLGLRVGLEGWSTWAVYILTGVLQFVLLGMALQFAIRESRSQRQEAAETVTSDLTTTEYVYTGTVDGADERTPLISTTPANPNASTRLQSD